MISEIVGQTQRTDVKLTETNQDNQDEEDPYKMGLKSSLYMKSNRPKRNTEIRGSLLDQRQTGCCTGFMGRGFYNQNQDKKPKKSFGEFFFKSKVRSSTKDKIKETDKSQEMKDLDAIIARELLSTPPSQEFLEQSQKSGNSKGSNGSSGSDGANKIRKSENVRDSKYDLIIEHGQSYQNPFALAADIEPEDSQL